MADGTAHMALSLLLPKHLSLGDLQKLSQTSSHLRLALRAIPPAAWEPALHRSGLQLSKPLPADTDMVTCLGEAAGLLHLYRKSPNLLRARCDFCRPAAVMMDQSMFLYTGSVQRLEEFYVQRPPGLWGWAYEWCLTLCFAQVILVSLGLDLSAWTLNKVVKHRLAAWRKGKLELESERICLCVMCHA